MIRFTKMQGIGNDFVMVDALQGNLSNVDWPELTRQTNDRRFGVGADGLIILERGAQAPFRMRMFNPDGSESEMCGNGIRCYAKLLRDHGHISEDQVSVETGAGVLHLSFVGDQVKVDMGKARLTRGEIGMVGPADEQFINQPVGLGFNGTAISMGNPHIVVFVDDVSAINLEEIGPKLENHELFPMRTNVHFVQVIDKKTLRMRTWERGAGITLACGTGACSVGVSAFLNGKAEREVLIHLPGGDLQIDYRSDGTVFMTGPAETVFEGVWSR